MPDRPVLRFAPSPNGELHLGHAHSALFTARMAARLGGRFLLRIEDIDPARSRPRYIDGIFEDLAWLGLAWEQPVLRQSEHMADYQAALSRLEAMGLVYRCFATRSEIAAAVRAGGSGARDPDGAPVYPGLHRGLSAAEIEARLARGEPFAWRLEMAKAVQTAASQLRGPLTFRELVDDQQWLLEPAAPERWGDVVLARKETPTSYHLSVVVDDARQGVTHVTRGKDLYEATGIHRLLQVLLGLPEPLYRHHDLILGESGRKLSKSARDTSLRALREAGRTAAEVRAMAGFPD
jgi:glutamyl-Q tRNA(Asp) synthetase